MATLEIKTTPINCISCACTSVDTFDESLGGVDPIVDSIVAMAKTSLAALISAAQASEGVSMAERGRSVRVDLEGCEPVGMPDRGSLSI